MQITNLFPKTVRRNVPARVALLMSGTGTNAEVLLRYAANRADISFVPVLLATDAPETSRARELGKLFSLPVVEHDIRRFYLDHGESGIALINERRRALRDEWTDGLRARLAPFRIDFIVLAGFVPLTNLTADYPCLNVHPGDLTVEEDGRRIFAGLHFRPVENAILRGLDHLRSSVILAQPYCGTGEAEMDSGPVLGLSPALSVDLDGHTVEELRAIDAARRPGHRDDPLRRLAESHLERLKYAGDHIVLPRVTEDFAAGRFGLDETGLCFRDGVRWHPIVTVEYTENSHRLRLR